MAREIEAKFRLPDPQALRDRLAQVGASRVGRVFEINRIFDTPERRLRSAGCGLRLRESQSLEGQRPTGRSAATGSASGAKLTFKGPRAPGELKSREEIETAVGDAGVVSAILDRLGFHEVIVYEKLRETWRLGDCEVTLDELPRLGWFAEIEGPTAAHVRIVRAQLALADAALVQETYVELAATHGDLDELGRRQLRFPTISGCPPMVPGG